MKEKIIYRRSAESIWKGGGVIEFLRLKNCLSRFPEKRQALRNKLNKKLVGNKTIRYTHFLPQISCEKLK